MESQTHSKNENDRSESNNTMEKLKKHLNSRLKSLKKDDEYCIDVRN